MAPLFGLAPGGACPPPCHHGRPGALTSRFHPYSGKPKRYVSVALSVGLPRLGVTQHPARGSSDFPLRLLGAATQPTGPSDIVAGEGCRVGLASNFSRPDIDAVLRQTAGDPSALEARLPGVEVSTAVGASDGFRRRPRQLELVGGDGDDAAGTHAPLNSRDGLPSAGLQSTVALQIRGAQGRLRLIPRAGGLFRVPFQSLLLILEARAVLSAKRPRLPGRQPPAMRHGSAPPPPAPS